MRLVWIKSFGHEWHLCWRRSRWRSQRSVCGVTWSVWDLPIVVRLGGKPPGGWRCSSCLDEVARQLGLGRDQETGIFEATEVRPAPKIVRLEDWRGR